MSSPAEPSPESPSRAGGGESTRPINPDIGVRFLVSSGETQKERWLREWQVYRALSTEAAEAGDNSEHEMPSSTAASAGLSEVRLPEGLLAPFDSDPESLEAGSIRLLDPALAPEAKRPVYVLILSDWAEDLKLIAPFGPLGAPASTMELRTDREEPHLAVVSLWNARVSPADILQRSWLIDRFDESELNDATAVWESGTLGEVLPARLRGMVGPPIEAEDDPRADYQTLETLIFAHLDEMLMGAGEPPVMGGLQNEPEDTPPSGDQTLEASLFAHRDKILMEPGEPLAPAGQIAQELLGRPVPRWPVDIIFVKEPQFAAWRRRQFQRLQDEFAGLTSYDQRVFCILWEGDLSALRDAIPGNAPPGYHKFAATTFVQPREDSDDPGSCLAQWQIEDAEAMKRLQAEGSFYVIGGENTTDSLSLIGQGKILKIGTGVYAVLEIGQWADFREAHNVTLLFPGAPL